jgi:hypothetical protein
MYKMPPEITGETKPAIRPIIPRPIAIVTAEETSKFVITPTKETEEKA